MNSNEQWRELEQYWLKYARISPAMAFQMLHSRYKLSTARFVSNTLNRIGGEIMARGKGKVEQKSEKSNGSWTQFVNIPVTTQDTDAIHQLASKGDEVFRMFSELCLAGYRVSFSWNDQSQAYIVAVTCRDENSVNNGMTCTSFAGDWFTALTVAMYKHYEVSKGIWKQSAFPDARPAFG